MYRNDDKQKNNNIYNTEWTAISRNIMLRWVIFMMVRRPSIIRIAITQINIIIIMRRDDEDQWKTNDANHNIIIRIMRMTMTCIIRWRRIAGRRIRITRHMILMIRILMGLRIIMIGKLNRERNQMKHNIMTSRTTNHTAH